MMILCWNKTQLNGVFKAVNADFLVVIQIEMEMVEVAMSRKIMIFLCFALMLILLSACRRDPQLANPASVYCEENGGKVDIRDEADGQVGYCVFPDGSECEEWAYYRGECQPGGE